jgi:hypothetical protein
VPLIKPLLLARDCVPTPRRLVFENVEGESIARLPPGADPRAKTGVDYESLMFAPGDGSVTLSSLPLATGHGSAVPRWEQQAPRSGANSIVCARHDALTSDDELLHALIEYLLAPDPADNSESH